MPTELPTDNFLTEQEVARILRVAPGTVRNIRERGEIAFLRVGFRRGRIVYRQDDVLDFIERSRRAIGTALAA